MIYNDTLFSEYLQKEKELQEQLGLKLSPQNGLPTLKE
jgi:hypothetical protein